MKFSGLILASLCCLNLVVNHSVIAAVKTAPAILVLGDSLSGAYGIDVNQGWVALLQQQIVSEGYNYKVINASVSGDTTRTGLHRIAPALQQHQPAIVIVALGANDGLRGFPFSEIETSLAGIIKQCRKANARVLLSAVRLPPNYGPAYNQRFTALYHGLSVRYEVPLVPQLLGGVAEQRELMQADGMHPKANAQPQIMQNVWTRLRPMLDKH